MIFSNVCLGPSLTTTLTARELMVVAILLEFRDYMVLRTAYGTLVLVHFSGLYFSRLWVGGY